MIGKSMPVKEGLSLFIRAGTESWNAYEYVYGRETNFIENNPGVLVKDTDYQEKQRNICDSMLDKEETQVKPAKEEKSSFIKSVLMKIVLFLELVAVVGSISVKTSNVAFGIPLMMAFYCFFLKNNKYEGNIVTEKVFGSKFLIFLEKGLKHPIHSFLVSMFLVNLFGNVDAIKHGSEVNPPKKYPFMIHGGTCMAVLLSPNAAIGSAQCCYTKLSLNAHNTSKVDDNVETFEVTESLFHPQYRIGSNMNDMVLLRLNGFTNNRPIMLKEKYNFLEEFEDNYLLLLVGWGATRYNADMSDVLMEGIIKYQSRIPCRVEYENNFAGLWTGGGRRDLICARNKVDEKTVRPCVGDFGGPIIDPDDGSLVGLVTNKFVSTCATDKFPDVFTNLNFHYEWIKDSVSKWKCPFHGTINYPTAAPTFTMIPSESLTFSPSILPSVVQTIEPTEEPTTKFSENPTKTHSPSISPTKMITKAPMKKNKKGQIKPPTKLTIKKNKKRNAQRIKSSRSKTKQTNSNCYWKETLVGEAIDNTKTDITDNKFVRIKTIVEKYVNIWTCTSVKLAYPIVSSVDPSEEKRSIPKEELLVGIVSGLSSNSEEILNDSFEEQSQNSFDSTELYPDYCYPFEPITDNNIEAAAKLWVEDKEKAMKVYHSIIYWDTRKVTNMDRVFFDLPTFNDNISLWITSRVTSMESMFEGANGFNVNISGWNISGVNNFHVSFAI
jgi:hypothetical protein